MGTNPDKTHFFVGDPLPQLPEWLMEMGRVDNCAPGSMIVPKGGRVNGLYYIKKGVVRVLRPSLAGPRRTLFIVNDGHFFFEAHYFQARELFSQAEVIREASLVFFEHETAQKLLAESPPFRNQVLESLSCKALIMGTELMAGAYSDPQEHILKILAKLHGNSTPEGLEIKVTQDELAELAGLHRVSINRTLRRLESEGRVKLMRGRIIITG